MEEPKTAAPPARSVIWLLAVSVGCVVANIYYAQPLLADIARSFGLTVTQIGSVVMLMQIGTAAGMLIFVPLGDMLERRGLISLLLVGSSIALVFTATARTTVWLCVAGFAVGATGATVHVIVPLAAHLAPEGQRGRIVGLVLGGMLIGILLARTFSGFIGAHLGWRAVYWLAAALMLGLSALIRWRLPESRPELVLRWTELMRSILSLVREHAELRESAVLGALFFCAFSAFWTTLVFLLATPPYHYGSSVAGLFGLVGAAGAAGAPLIGRLSDTQGPRRTILWALLATILAYGILAALGHNLAGLVVGVVLLDLGVQSGHVANQTRIYGLAPNARSRLNTAYMVSYFVGGSVGSAGGAACWRYAGWGGVCAFSIAVLLVALGFWFQGGSRAAALSRRTI